MRGGCAQRVRGGGIYEGHEPRPPHSLPSLAPPPQGKVEIRPMMYIALTYDHRLIDGREAVSFLVSVRDKIEDPRRLLLGL